MKDLSNHYIGHDDPTMPPDGGEESRIIEGCAVVFNQKTTLWQSPDGSYVEEEIIDSSCITEEWLKEQDVKLNLLHNRADTVAMDPAYEQTSVNAREIYREQHPELTTGEEQHQDDAEVEFQREVQRAKREARKALRATKVNTLW